MVTDRLRTLPRQSQCPGELLRTNPLPHSARGPRRGVSSDQLRSTPAYCFTLHCLGNFVGSGASLRVWDIVAKFSGLRSGSTAVTVLFGTVKDERPGKRSLRLGPDKPCARRLPDPLSCRFPVLCLSPLSEVLTRSRREFRLSRTTIGSLSGTTSARPLDPCRRQLWERWRLFDLPRRPLGCSSGDGSLARMSLLRPRTVSTGASSNRSSSSGMLPTTPPRVA